MGSKQEEQVKESVASYLDEGKDREDRAKNIILYNLPEPKDQGEEGQKNDLITTQRVLDDIVEKEDKATKEAVVTIKRLGKPPTETDQRPRPIKVTLNSTEAKAKIIQQARNLKHSSSFNKVGVSNDMTLQERETHKKLVREMNRRRGQGENVIIKDGQIIPRTPTPSSGGHQKKGEPDTTPTNTNEEETNTPMSPSASQRGSTNQHDDTTNTSGDNAGSQ